MKTSAKLLLLLPLATVALAAYDRQAGAQPGAKSPAGQRPSAESAQRPAAPPGRVPDGVKAHRDLAYFADGHQRQKLDLFLPEKAGAPLPLIIWVHGGGWQSGSKEQCLPLRLGFVERGYTVASIGYRLSGDAIFPAQIEDCKAAIRWLRAHAKEYNLDPDHFGVWGSSAGGHLVALIGASGGAKEFDRGEHLDVSSRVQAVCDYYGPTDLLQMDAHALPGSQLEHDLPSSPESRLIGGAIQASRQQAAKANPITYVTKDAPPFLIVHGDQDPLVPHHQSQLLYEALKQAGVEVRFHTVQGGGHGSGFGGPELDGIVAAFFDRCLKGTPQAASQPAAMVSASAALGKGEARPGPPTAQPSVAPGRSQPRGGDQAAPRPAADAAAPAGRPRGAEPSWLMPPVEGPHLFYKTFQSKTAGRPVSYLIYLPPDYETTKDRRYPVVYWLHGIGGSQQGVPTMAARLTKAIEEGKSPPMIVVYVNGAVRSGYVDTADGKWPVETVTIKELIPHIDATYRTIATREGRCVEGFSMGGGGAAKWGFKYPELFGTVSILAGAMFDSAGLMARGGEARLRETYGSVERFNESNPWLLVEKHRESLRGRTTIRVVVGEKDGLQATNQRFHELLEKLDLKHEFHIIPGAPHSPNPLYDGLGEKNWSFFREAFAKRAETPQATRLDGKPAALALGDAPQPAPTRTATAVAAPEPEQARSSGKLVVKDFQLQGERWTCEVNGRPLSGILLKPEGKGPLPAVLISHGLGGSAESFGLSKAREMVKWGLVCIAPNYTHNVRGGPRPPAAKPVEAGQRAGEGGKDAAARQPRGAQPPDFGASEENIRRALACVEILRGLPEVDARRLAAYGHSMGGFVTVGLAAAEPGLLKAAAISGSGVAPQAGFPAPTAKAAENIRTPLLMLHGGSDPVVRPGQSDLLKQVLDRNQVPNERHVFEGEGHPIDQTRRDEVFQRMRAWFSRHGVLRE